MLSLYSLIWTFLISCPMLLLIFILRRRSDYLTKYGVTFISILYIFCTVRMLFPIEFPSHQKVICDPYLYSFLMNLYAKSEDIHKKIVMAVILTIWIIGIIIAVVHKMREWNKVKGYLIKGTSEGDGVAEKILREIDSECPIKIEYNLAIAEPFIKGLRHPVIYLPEKECNEKELEFILMHEYLHWKRKDLWKKFIINIIGMIFWWNPLAYLLCKDLEFAIYDLKIRQYTNIPLAKDDNDITVETLTPKEWLNSENFAFNEYLEWNKNFLVFPINIFNSKKSEDELAGFIMYKKEKDFALNNMNIAYILGILSII